MATNSNLNIPQSPFLDNLTGRPAREWMLFLMSPSVFQITSTTALGVTSGGTGITAVPNYGQLLIGNGTGYTLNTLGHGAGISVTNGSGTITLANTGVLSIIAGTGISVSGSTGNVTINSTSLSSISIATSNGFAGTSSGGANPIITLTTTVTGLLKGNGTAISAAVANVDYVAPSTVLTVTTDYTIGNGDSWIINNKAGSALTLTFPAASSWPGRYITIKNLQTQLVNSASSNIVPIDSATAGTAILLNVIGNWATMVSDGTNWVIMQAAPNNILLLE